MMIFKKKFSLFFVIAILFICNKYLVAETREEISNLKFNKKNNLQNRSQGLEGAEKNIFKNYAESQKIGFYEHDTSTIQNSSPITDTIISAYKKTKLEGVLVVQILCKDEDDLFPHYPKGKLLKWSIKERHKLSGYTQIDDNGYIRINISYEDSIRPNNAIFTFNDSSQSISLERGPFILVYPHDVCRKNN